MSTAVIINPKSGFVFHARTVEAFKSSLRTYFRNRYYRVILLNRHRSFDWSWLKINQKVFVAVFDKIMRCQRLNARPASAKRSIPRPVCELFIKCIAGQSSVGRRVICRPGVPSNCKCPIRVDFSDANVLRATIWMSKEV